MRVIAATHKDLAEMVKKGEFREDLFYRINVIRMQVPPLRERKDDLPILIDHFMRKHRREGQRARALSPEALAILQRLPLAREHPRAGERDRAAAGARRRPRDHPRRPDLQPHPGRGGRLGGASRAGLAHPDARWPAS